MPTDNITRNILETVAHRWVINHLDLAGIFGESPAFWLGHLRRLVEGGVLVDISNTKVPAFTTPELAHLHEVSL